MKSLLVGEGDAGRSGFYGTSYFGYDGVPEFTACRGTSVRLSEGFLVLMAVCSVRSSYVLYLVVVSMVVLSQAILCPVVREWWAGADWLWEKSSGLCKWSLEWDSCSLILLIKGRFVSLLGLSSFCLTLSMMRLTMSGGVHFVRRLRRLCPVLFVSFGGA